MNPAYPLNIRQRGSIIIDGREVANTVQCCHCAGHFLYQRGSGTTRGFCTRCSQITCGKPECDPCRPFEKWLEMVERKS